MRLELVLHGQRLAGCAPKREAIVAGGADGESLVLDVLRLGSLSRGLAELHFGTRGCKGERCVVGRETLERLVGGELMTTFDETFEDGHHEMIDGVSVLRLGVPHQQERLLSIEVVLDRFSWRAVALAVLRATVGALFPSVAIRSSAAG